MHGQSGGLPNIRISSNSLDGSGNASPSPLGRQLGTISMTEGLGQFMHYTYRVSRSALRTSRRASCEYNLVYSKACSHDYCLELCTCTF